MQSLFATSDRTEILERLDRLQPGATRPWGKMGPVQMLAHEAVAMEMATGDEWGVMMRKHLDHPLRQFGL